MKEIYLVQMEKSNLASNRGSNKYFHKFVITF